ncbi:MAG TPA: peptidase inhibitor family I36 protein [Vicinamibacterales bacterium]|jgi:hypothetical protein|nr:peptidase inhibitor family I36 protein [Vicinamibacterales bacterium]
MIRRRAVILLVAVVGLCDASLASAQPVWGHERYPNSGACFYENANYEGRYFCIRDGERVSEMPHNMNDKISSIRLFGNAEAAVWRDHNMSGKTARFVTSQRNLRDTGWNDQISSLEVFPAHRGGESLAWGRAPQPREGACFYEDNNFKGRYFCVQRGGEHAELGREFNNSIRSIRVFNGADVRIFIDRDFHGRSVDLRHDVADLHGVWRDNISSIRVH